MLYATAAILSQHQTVVTLANGGSVSASALFSAIDWAASYDKVIIVPAGVIRGSTNPAVPVIACGSGRGGRLRLVVNGQLQGAGGNSSDGGDCIDASAQTGVFLEGTGVIKSGGGAGGAGGAGGQGSVPNSHLVTEGPNNSSTNPVYGVRYDFHTGELDWYWGATSTSTPLFTSSGINSNNVVNGGWTYFWTSQPDSFGTMVAISRKQTVTDPPTITAGGAGGTGGRGAGYDGAAAAGSAGGTGGTSAGNGGTGGTGGAFGVAGTNGSAGTNGNSTNGAAGGTAKLAGYALKTIANIVNSFTGTLTGRTV